MEKTPAIFPFDVATPARLFDFAIKIAKGFDEVFNTLLIASEGVSSPKIHLTVKKINKISSALFVS